jgi:hypothetical protein
MNNPVNATNEKSEKTIFVMTPSVRETILRFDISALESGRALWRGSHRAGFRIARSRRRPRALRHMSRRANRRQRGSWPGRRLTD